MERLTKSGVVSQRDINKLLELSNENQFGANNAYYKLKHYEDLEEQGKLIKLPCKIGDPVYKIVTQRDSFDDQEYEVVTSVNFTYDKIPQIGHTVFLTCEEAEERLKKRNWKMIEAKIVNKIVSNNKEFEIGDDVYFKLQRNGKLYHINGKIVSIYDDGFCINNVRLDDMRMSDALFVKFGEVQDGAIQEGAINWFD